MGIWDKLKSKDHNYFYPYALVLTVLFLLYVCVFGRDSLWRWARAGMELRSQRRQIERYQQEIDAMDRQIRMLSDDRDSLEEFARENFGFAAPGDDVYIDE